MQIFHKKISPERRNMNTFAKLAYTLAATSALVMAITASAQTTTTSATFIEGVNKVDINAPTPYNAYVQDANGHIVRDAYGDCWHTGYWTPADATVVGCDGYVAPVAAAVQPAQAKPVPTSEKVTYAADAFFDFDKSVLKPEGKHALNELIGKLKYINVEAIVATGHTDAIGTVAYNQKLSVRRAEAVKHYMVSHGVAADRIYVSGKGKSQPIATNKTAAGRAKNRRVDVEVVGTRLSDGSVAPAPAPVHHKHHERHHTKPHHGTHHKAPHHAPKAQPAQPAAQPQ
jgi:OOP family OmpA-OmpF porin